MGSVRPSRLLAGASWPVWLLIMVSGNPVFLAPSYQVEGLILVLVAFVAAAHIRGELLVVEIRSFGLITGLVLLVLFQAVDLRFVSIATIGGFVVRMLIAYEAQALSADFLDEFAQGMRFLVLLSLPFFGLMVAAAAGGVDLFGLLYPFRLVRENASFLTEFVHIGVHNFGGHDDDVRNSGVFWEPGAFAGYLLLALVLNSIVRKESSARRSTAWILIVGVLTTQSSMGYVLLPLVCLLYYDSESLSNVASKVSLKIRSAGAIIYAIGFAILLLLGVFLLLVADLPFMQEKIFHQYFEAVNRQTGYEITRFGSVIFNMDYVMSRPLTGWGLHSETRFALDPFASREVLEAQSNGLFDFLAKMGILGLFAWIGGFCYSLRLRGVSWGRTSFIVVTTCLILNGEVFLSYPLFLSLMFVRRAQREDGPAVIGLQVPRAT